MLLIGASHYGIEIVALAGGVFMNRYLMERTACAPAGARLYGGAE